MKKIQQWFLGLFGVTVIIIAAVHVFFGPSSIPGSVPVNATMDSEDRFYAVLFAAYGAALLWCIGDIEKKSLVVHFLSGTFFLGGLARLISIAAVGPPNRFFLAMTVLELLIPAYMSIAQRRIAAGTARAGPTGGGAAVGREEFPR